MNKTLEEIAVETLENDEGSMILMYNLMMENDIENNFDYSVINDIYANSNNFYSSDLFFALYNINRKPQELQHLITNGNCNLYALVASTGLKATHKCKKFGEKEFMLIRNAYELGNVKALTKYGLCNLEGFMVKKDIPKAKELLLEASSRGDGEADFHLNNIHKMEQKFWLAETYKNRACANGMMDITEKKEKIDILLKRLNERLRVIEKDSRMFIKKNFGFYLNLVFNYDDDINEYFNCLTQIFKEDQIWLKYGVDGYTSMYKSIIAT